MAFIALDPINVGDPVKKDEYDRISDNFTDHESRINSLESGVTRIQVFDTYIVSAIATITVFPQSIQYYRAPVNFSVTSAVITQLSNLGSSGTLEIDLLQSSSIGGPYTSLFSTKPQLVPGDGPNAEDAGVLVANSISTGEYLRLDITSTQVAQRDFFINIYGEVS